MGGPPSRGEASDFSRAGLSPAEEEALDRIAIGASAAEVAEALALRPHREGGFFREIYRSPLTLLTDCGERCLATSILYLLTGGSPSRFHRLRSDEIWFYHRGCRAELATLAADRGRPAQSASGPRGPRRPPGREESRLRLRFLGAEQPQMLVPGGWWLGARVVPGTSSGERAGALGDSVGDGACGGRTAGTERDWTLVGCVVSPGFEYEDFELAEPGALLREFPEAAHIIDALT